MSYYRTSEGDMVDAIAKRLYGREDMAVAIHEANPGLAARGPVLSAGVVISLPPAPAPEIARPIRLWGDDEA